MRTAAVLTISDSSARGKRADHSGPATVELLRQEGFDVIRMEIVPDDQPTIESALVRLSDEVPLIVTTGGTGIADRDVTPEATRAVCSKLIEGIPERMRAEGTVNTSYAILSRGVCGVRGRTLILNLPGSPTGASESLLAVIEILPHALDLVAGQTEHDDAHPPGDT
ncbi:MAG: MogA/MoaB family molybdenum cofactor biosynthesis protein [Candidatus Korobacteraceae bacterium]|jgi:molybdenum cofactor synthesis domain-containing protein